ncbi:MAG: hypothetical protein IPM12_02450 [Flavobacteriales bacterium]|nr:hypothetical protein [Flavobacteriales bacterium]
MRQRTLVLLLALLPIWVLALAPPQPEQPVLAKQPSPLNATTLAVLLANQPKGLSWDQWLCIMKGPDGPVLYPLRVTETMLDTLEGREMDLRFRYMVMKELPAHR